jgi:hypothetical protein
LDDLDGDGHLDVYIVGNFDGPEPMHTGAYDGSVSVMLRGDGAGNFEAVPVTESGLSVPEEAKGLASSDYDLDGWVDLAVGLNNGALKVFKNHGVPDRGGIQVRLTGFKEGNPTAVGAKVTVERADGSGLTREVQAGGSFLSQSSAGLVFGLGEDMAPVNIHVRWPDGTMQTEPRVRVDEPVVVIEYNPN